MRVSPVFTAIAIASFMSAGVYAQPTTVAATETKPKASAHKAASKNLFIDVHHLGAGNVTAKAVADAHAKDLATQGKYGVKFMKYWVDEAKGDVYCLSSTSDPQSIRKAHAEAHGLLPDQIYQVTDGHEASAKSGKNFYLDVHELGAGKVTAKDVAAAHQKDLATQKKYGVNFINYWVDEKDGVVMCLSQAPDSLAVINTHKEAHGLLPVSIEKVKQGQ